ncbi:hypothetical protein Ddye_014211 [Dipteronia dyeriana]|uniref:Protein kinase domain-containing protein n=1 Tax=Dipteronia dyeriana TaxID=168575 RepID=A0AAE0CKA7_9ROSI|nr:hypothetical protein Ddye_014211 [Dipteronia dyeriana]
MMEKRKYVFIEEVGAGVFGRVWKAVDKYSGEVVAIKKLIRQKLNSREECLSLREIKSLRILKHPNIVSLKKLFKINTRLFLVFEYMECNLLQVMRSRKGRLFSEDEVRKWCFQVFQGLHFMLEKGYFHRDLKPENLLVSKD